MSARRRMSRWDWFLDLTSRETDECTLWPFACTGAGYGSVHEPTVGVVRTHRRSLELHKGPPPRPGLQAAHSCNRRACINPRHLRWATPSENALDRIGTETDFRGENNTQSKMTWAEVAEIRAALERGERGCDLARRYRISPQLITDIKMGRRWRAA